MKILPARTSPPSSLIERRHSPEPAKGRYGYRKYRPCLRWDFGFTCAFCLLHEADLVEHGVEGTGLTSVEHFIPVGGAGPINDYSNCFYACRFCNQARSDLPVVSGKQRLLDPCANVWAEHFTLTADDQLVPVDGDSDAAYTHQSYDLDDPRKVDRRRVRRERLGEWRQLLEEGPGLLEELLARTSEQPSSGQRAFLQAAEWLRRSIESAILDIQRYAAIPPDADAACRCGYNDHHALPTGLGSQVVEIKLS